MKNAGYLLLFVLLIVLSIPSLRQKAINLVFNGTTKPKGVTIEDIKKAQNKNKQSFSSDNLKMTIHSVSTYSPSIEEFKIKEGNKEFLVYKVSIENISDKEIDPSWFMTTFFIEDANGKLYHNFLDQMTGYYQENPEKYTAETKALIDNYYGNTMAAKSTFAPKLFFFPVPVGAQIVKLHFDDPITQEQNEFELRK
jgi:hypothetical protein